jgi:hypothetical protein
MQHSANRSPGRRYTRPLPSENRRDIQWSKVQFRCFRAKRSRACRWAAVSFGPVAGLRGVRFVSCSLRLTVHSLTASPRISQSSRWIWTAFSRRFLNDVDTMKRLSLSDVYLPTSTCSWSPIEGTSVLKSLVDSSRLVKGHLAGETCAVQISNQ